MRRTGYNILGEFLTPPGKDLRSDILTHLRAYRPTVVTVMDNPTFAGQIADVTGGETLVIHRHYHPHDGYGNVFRELSAEAYADFITYNRTLDKRLLVQVWNEPSTKYDTLPELLRKTIDVAELLTKWGYRGVLGNIGTATIQPETIATGVFDEYLTRLGEWSAAGIHYAGYHEYTAILAPFGVGYWSVDDLREPLKMQPENWPEIQNPSGYFASLRMIENLNAMSDVAPEPAHYWHIRRLEWLQDRAVLIGVARHKYIITENFLDRMGDVSIIYPYLEQTYGVTSDWEIKGAPTLVKVWAGWWPYWSKDEALAQQCWWLERNYDNDCLGWTLFCFCRDDHMTDKAQKWETGYDISDWLEFQRLMVVNRDTPAKPEVTPPGPAPDPPDIDPEPDPISEAPNILFILMLFVCACVIGAFVYSILQPRLVAQGVQIMQPDQNLVDIYNVLANIPIFAAVAFGLPVIYYLMEIWKRLIDPKVPMPPQDQVWGKLLGFIIKPSPSALFIALVMVMSGSYYLAGTLGEGESFKQITQFLVDLINAVGKWAFPMLALQVVGSRGYDHFRSKETLGFNATSIKRNRAA